jgi:hypothetical protein
MPAAARGRPKGYRVPDEVKAKIGQGVSDARHASSIQSQEYWRGKIKTVAIINALGEHVNGTREMSATQVQAGLGLLRKVLPDLASTEHKGDPLVTLRTIITGVIRQEDLEASPSVTKVIEHQPSHCDPSPNPPATPDAQTALQGSVIEKETGGGGE